MGARAARRAALAAVILVASVTFVGSGVDKQIAARTADEYRALPPGQRERTAMIVAAYIDRSPESALRRRPLW